MSRRRYMNHMREAVEESRRQTDGGPVTLLAHSAGGWLARVYLLSFGTEGGLSIQWEFLHAESRALSRRVDALVVHHMSVTRSAWPGYHRRGQAVEATLPRANDSLPAVSPRLSSTAGLGAPP